MSDTEAKDSAGVDPVFLAAAEAKTMRAITHTQNARKYEKRRIDEMESALACLSSIDSYGLPESVKDRMRVRWQDEYMKDAL